LLVCRSIFFGLTPTAAPDRLKEALCLINA
jgi:hypothetical protein